MQSPRQQYGHRVNEMPEFVFKSGPRLQHPPPPPSRLFSLSHGMSLSTSSGHSHPEYHLEQLHLYHHQQQQEPQQQQQQPQASQHQQHQQQMQLGLGGPDSDPEASSSAPSPVGSRPDLATSCFSKQLTAVADAVFTRDSLPTAAGLDHEEALRGEPADDDDIGTEVQNDGRSTGGNRWPQQETLALINIRSEMDASFRDSGLKGPLWEEVARRLAELGYNRSAKKCKEKFENIYKYYKKSKSGKAGRQDGKNYHFFSELDSLYAGAHNASTIQGNAAASVMQSGSGHEQLADVSLFGAAAAQNATSEAVAVSDSSEDHNYDEPGRVQSHDSDEKSSKKRKLHKETSRPEGSSSKVLFLESLVKQLMDKQEAMQQKFLESIQRWEQDRLVQEEAWKRQEMAHLTLDHQFRTQQHNLAVSRDAALVAALQKVTGLTLQLPQLPPPPRPPFPVQTTTVPEPPHQTHVHHQQEHLQDEPEKDGSMFDPHSNRWPTPEVHALIHLRSGIESRFQETGAKGPLWEEISIGMSSLGYTRNAKRCKEKWENVNKYFRKTKESSKKRPENAKTCPYFHQLDTLYSNGILGSPRSKPSKVDAGQSTEVHDHQQSGVVDNSNVQTKGTGLVHEEDKDEGMMVMQQLPATARDGAPAGGSTSNGP